MTDRELMQQALYALEAMQAYAEVERKGLRICDEAIAALRERLAQPEQEPVGEVVSIEFHEEFRAEAIVSLHQDVELGAKLYTTPPRREWVGLTDEEIRSLNNWWPSYDDRTALMVLIRDAEAKLKEKNA